MTNNESSEAEKRDQVDESDTESGQELEDSIIRQSLVERRMAVSPRDAVVTFPHISGTLQQTTSLPNTVLEISQSFGKFLLNLASIYREPTFLIMIPKFYANILGLPDRLFSFFRSSDINSAL
jgi:hypothetical protein